MSRATACKREPQIILKTACVHSPRGKGASENLTAESSGWGDDLPLADRGGEHVSDEEADGCAS